MPVLSISHLSHLLLQSPSQSLRCLSEGRHLLSPCLSPHRLLLCLPLQQTSSPGSQVPSAARGPAHQLLGVPSLLSLHTQHLTRSTHPPILTLQLGLGWTIPGVLGQTQVGELPGWTPRSLPCPSASLHGPLSERQGLAVNSALCPAHQVRPQPGSQEPYPDRASAPQASLIHSRLRPPSTSLPSLPASVHPVPAALPPCPVHAD